MNLKAKLIIHPYSANPETGFGHDRYAYELIQNLPEFAITPEIFATRQCRTIAQAFLSEPEAVFRLILADKSTQIFHATASLNAQCAITARKHPLVTTIHDVLWFFVKDKYDSSLKCKFKTRAIIRAAKNSDAIIVPFPFIKNFLVEGLNIQENKVRVIHHGINHKSFYPQNTNEKINRPSFFPKDKKIVLFVGGLTWGKGADTLIDSFQYVVKEVPEAVLILGSEGWDSSFIKELCNKSPVKDKIIFTGFIPEKDLRAYYIYADVMAFPSRYGYGLSTHEAMACGTPTVSGGVLDGVDAVEQAGLLVNPDDSLDLAEKINLLLKNPKVHQEYRDRGLQHVKKFRWEKTASETAALYRDILNR